MSKWNYAIVAAGALALFSCEKEIAYKGESGTPRLVVNAVTEKDTEIKVQLERSRFFLESSNGNFAITQNAVVTLTDVTTGQVYVSAAAGTDGLYDLGTTATANHQYTLQVTHPDYETVSAATRVPDSAPILSVDTSSYLQQGGSYMKANVTWNDPSGDDYYVMKLAVYNTVQGQDVFPQVQLASFDPSLDELSSSELGSENFSARLFFTDDLFDGSQKTMEVRFPHVTFSPDEHYKFILFRCNEETYKYLVSTEKAGYDDPFSEPVKVFTNIANGFGIFGSLARSSFVK